MPVAANAGTAQALSTALFFALALLLVFGVAGPLARQSATVKRRVAAGSAITAVGLIAFTDFPTPLLADFWTDHALFSSALLTVLILGAGLLAVDAQGESRKAQRVRSVSARVLKPVLDDLDECWRTYEYFARQIARATDAAQDHDKLRLIFEDQAGLGARDLLGQVLSGTPVVAAEAVTLDQRPQLPPRIPREDGRLTQLAVEAQEWRRLCLLIDSDEAWAVEECLSPAVRAVTRLREAFDVALLNWHQFDHEELLPPQAADLLHNVVWLQCVRAHERLQLVMRTLADLDLYQVDESSTFQGEFQLGKPIFELSEGQSPGQ